ncbi:CD151 antigen-like [Coccinella septempunctata]|uniref:CD151 antigen-like n=1 Tax=Coccinella septempunctata TaxID=41139 RepID=UPI001D065653|nr:CD151 antigen-like [Coccinella septempunctata]
MARKGCCSTTCLKNILNFFNLIFLFVALGVLAVTIWNLGNQSELIDLLTSPTYSILIDFLMVAGAILLVVSFLGCYGVIKENRKFLLLYVFVLLFIVLMELMVAFLGYIYKENVDEELKVNLNRTMLDNFGIDDSKTRAIDVMQRRFSCCGAVQFEDWQYSIWRTSNMTKNLVPDSCCKTITTGCGVRDHPSNINYDGCLDKMEEEMKNGLITMILLGLGVGLTQIIGIILGIQLYLNLKEEIDINELRRILHNT